MIRFVTESHGTKMIDAETGADLSKVLGLTKAEITIAPNGIVAQCEMTLIETDVTAGRTEFLALHPVTGHLAPLATIAFRDGWKIDFLEDGTPRLAQSVTFKPSDR